MDDELQPRLVRIPKGTHLSDSKDTPGAQRDMLFEDGTNKLLGPAESFPFDEDMLRRVRDYEPSSPSRATRRELSPAQQRLADALGDVVYILLREVAVPYLAEVVAPAIGQKISEAGRAAKRKLSGQAGRVAGHSARRAETPSGSSSQLAAQADQPVVSMSSAEFRQRFLAALAAEAFAAEQKRILSNVRIEDEHLTPELRRAMQLVLGGSTDLLDERTLAEIATVMGLSRTPDGQYLILIRAEGPPLPRRRPQIAARSAVPW